ncbi:transcriptional regulator, HxlR family [Methylophaga sulfidovorans]|uniref:Transcriptional regulator, HxlR family n=2 Tax=Methylophaga sulfidovorans TaxID=45496 RepID=A0A1I3W553_9GAMM|nr:transcriptional regulator, HxlR family [Methylophaga sulfidovorans]
MRWDVYNKNCPTRLVLDRIADKWTVLTVGALVKETKRFSQLQRELDGISQKMLTQTLRGLERDGLVHRQVYPTVPPKVEYSLTSFGRTLVELLEGIKSWSENNIEQVIEAQQAYDKQVSD